MSFLRFFTIVKEKSACIVERFGRYHKTLEPGLHFMVPVMDQIAYRKSLKEETIQITEQNAITKDNVTVTLDGALFVQILDPYKASYKVERPFEAVKQLGVTVVRSEIGKMKLDRLFQERAELNSNVNDLINKACEEWGLACLRYEILNIEPPSEIKISMQYEAQAERLKRREILISEGRQQAQINIAQGQKKSLIKKAEGLAQSLEIISQKEAEGLEQIAEAIQQNENSDEIIPFLLTQKYLEKYQQTLQKSNLVVTPKGQGQDGQGSSDLVNMAALMLLQQSNPSGKFDSKFVEEAIKQIQAKNSGQQGSPEMEINSQQLINQMQYYDDPLLYGDSNLKQEKMEQLSEEEKEDLLYDFGEIEKTSTQRQGNNSSSSTNSSVSFGNFDQSNQNYEKQKVY